MGQAVLLFGLLAAAPPAPARPVPEPDAGFADEVWPAVTVLTGEPNRDGHVRKPNAGELVAAAVAGLYTAANRPVPADLVERATATNSEPLLRDILARARADLGPSPALAGRRAFLIAVNSLGRAADPYTAIDLRQPGQPGGSALEFGLGFELQDVQPTGLDWLVYEASLGERGQEPPAPPLPLPWRIGRVLPGGPAAAAGMRPGDTLTAVDGDPLTPATAPGAMRRLLAGRSRLDEDAQSDKPLHLTLRRPGAADPVTVRLAARAYSPDSVFGYRRTADGRWDYLPDRRSRVGYIRIGFVELGAEEVLAAAVARVQEEQSAGLVLDLRWCPGGYVDPCRKIAAHFLKPGQTLYVERKWNERNPIAADLFDSGPDTWAALPIAVLVSPETAGGGELIAAAIQDHARGIVVGQRTFGRASTSLPHRIGESGFSLRVTVGYSDRVTGQNRHRLPTHGPTDEWGVRPNPGCVVPVSPDASRRLRDWADRQALRTGGETDAGPLDDPLDDPQRVLAEKLLKQRIAAGRP